MNQENITDIAVIGAGPVGLFSVFEAGMLQMKCHVIDSLEFLGGQCMALYPEKPIYDIPAHPQISAEDLIRNLEKQAAPFHPTYHLNQQVVAVEKIENKFKLTTSNGNVIIANSIIIAAGCGAFGPNRPPMNNLEKFENKSVFYMVNNKSIFNDKKVVIAGGGDSAIDWTMSLAETASKVYLVHRRPKFRCAPENYARVLKLVDSGKVELVIPYQLDDLEGEDGKISAVIVKDLDGNVKKLAADYLLPFFGLAMELGPIANWGLSLDHHNIAVQQQTMSTNIEGIYAIGDIAKYPNKLKLILSGFAEAATACYQIYNRVNPDQALHFEYSTTKGIKSI